MDDERDVPIVDEGDEAPFSKGLMAQTLHGDRASRPSRPTAWRPPWSGACGAAGRRRSSLADLREIAREQLGELAGDILIQRFRQWQKLRRLETPLIVLIGGATGVGKSTVATELAHRLGITRVIGTDQVRETMRAFFAPELMPAIHTSSFDAASAVRLPVPRETDLSKVGFIEQTKAVAVGLEALVARGIDEAQRMVVEGVHIVPGFLDSSRWREALVAEFVLAVSDKDRHRANFTVREWESGGIRPLRRYLEHFAQNPPHPEVHRRAGEREGRARGGERGAGRMPRRSPRHDPAPGRRVRLSGRGRGAGTAEATDFRRRADTGY